ncbi:MAG: FAD-dependent oxidoreductase, partial [Cryobacterium sp.]|nr:FAD-dependent oxidoreductase [Cryobacterium sp.]
GRGGGVAAKGEEGGAARADVLLTRYGTRATDVIAWLTAEPDAPLAQHAGYTRREIELIAATESVMHLIDLLLRRTSIAFRGEVTLALLVELSGVLAPVLGWDAARSADEVGTAANTLRDMYGVQLAPAETPVV